MRRGGRRGEEGDEERREMRRGGRRGEEGDEEKKQEKKRTFGSILKDDSAEQERKRVCHCGVWKNGSAGGKQSGFYLSTAFNLPDGQNFLNLNDE
ncbi:hypothetical protein JOQ06_019829 [Pogonophryne albipinna]|uniref:Uncharacterized protein n=1 Tax=Pogonophryne albipinna TaxID=1090488 RepID=A0AAD6BPC6_9TELE|nr:hypothetical protein JOQ06_019829 [Pogonophryne albipinna]